ncbi:unnamed protein product [Rotaria sp. Silwood2]|nr:unnamed protein product [Rotaria sp. Silwood2]CAF2949093.1 unnamed protein product [Rotaria sp. Silwood2]CAF4081108.1 unnamed protein product [Rotaria sp. Silwood2]CAF4509776.1 unnamed protein product [Rotaria sp. Silwood2]
MSGESTVVSIEKQQTVPRNDDENKESTTLIWFDPKIGSREDTERTKQQLRLINDYVTFSTDLDQCIRFIQSIHKEKIFLITSGSKTSQILPRISSLNQIDSVFIFCAKKTRYEYLLNEYSNIIGIYINLQDLCKAVKEQIDFFYKQIQTFSFFDQHEKSIKDLSKESAEFLWFQLFNYVIARLPRDQQAKQQMIQICRQYYRGNTTETKLINDFEQNYRSEDAIHWYSKQSFLYKLINKALRTEDIDLLHAFRFFIGDLSENLQREHKRILSSEEKIINVYRGIKLHKEEFNKLKESQGKLISTNGYLSTSRRELSALSFASKPTKRVDVIPVLFHIQCDITKVDQNIIFADIDQYSEYPGEKEVLFNLNACFEIESIEEKESLQIIKMNLSSKGQKITKDFIESAHKEAEELSVSIVFGRLLCDLGEYNKSQNYFQQLLNNSNNEDRAWIEFNIGRALDLKGEWNQAREYFDRAYDRMMKSKPPRIKDSAHVLNNIGVVLYRQGKYELALDYHQRALKIHENFCSSGHIDIAASLVSIGNIFFNQGKYDKALDYYQQALKIQEKSNSSGDIRIAPILHNIGAIFEKQEKYDEALNFNHQALKIREKIYSSGNVDIATSLNNIGNILLNQGKYDEALHYHQQALKMREKFYPSGHVDIATSLNNIGVVLHQQRKYDDALDYYQQALKTREAFYPFGHIDIATSFNNIGVILDNQGKYDAALDYHQRALKIREKFYPYGHVDIAQSLNNIGLILYRQKKCVEALDSHHRALKIRKAFYPSGHIDIATSLNNIGRILHHQGKYEEALDYHQQALKILEKFYPSGHVDVASSLNSIGVCYENQNKQKMALDYYQRALAIYEKFLPVDHPNRQRTEKNIRQLNGKN